MRARGAGEAAGRVTHSQTRRLRTGGPDNSRAAYLLAILAKSAASVTLVGSASFRLLGEGRGHGQEHDIRVVREFT